MFSTDVIKNQNGTYTVVDGREDGDRNIYVVWILKRTGWKVLRKMNNCNICIEECHLRELQALGIKTGKLTTFASARDIGNVAAGYIAAENGLSWSGAKRGFDLLEIKKNWTWTKEGKPTQAAQRVGWTADNAAWNRFVDKSYKDAQKNMITP